jgi:hypothetical protein
MAGTLTLSTLSDGTNSTSATNAIQGSAKAWVNFNGGNGNTAGVINASYNVSSVTQLATGFYQVTLTNAMTDANYVIASNHIYANDNNSTSADDVYGGWLTNKSPTTTQFWVFTRSNGSGVINVFRFHSVVFGN